MVAAMVLTCCLRERPEILGLKHEQRRASCLGKERSMKKTGSHKPCCLAESITRILVIQDNPRVMSTAVVTLPHPRSPPLPRLDW